MAAIILPEIIICKKQKCLLCNRWSQYTCVEKLRHHTHDNNCCSFWYPFATLKSLLWAFPHNSFRCCLDYPLNEAFCFMMLVGDTAISNGWSLFPLLTWLLTLQIPQIIRKSFGHWNPRDLWDNVIRKSQVHKYTQGCPQIPWSLK